MSEEDIRAIFTKNFNTLMVKNNITQSDVAKALDVSKATVSSWAAGDKIPRMEKVKKLANLFCVPVSALLEEDVDYTDNDAFRNRMREEYGVLFDLVDKADDTQRDQIEKIVQAIVPEDDWEGA